VEGSATSETEEQTAHRVGALTTLGTFALTDRKSKMMAINLGRSHLIRELLGTSGLKNGAAGAVGR
jgi:hypothetical protein